MEIRYIYIYIWYIYIRRYVMWKELSVCQFYDVVTTGNEHKNVLKWNRALWLLFSIKSSDYCTATVAKLNLFSTCTRSAVRFGSVKKLKALCIAVKQSSKRIWPIKFQSEIKPLGT